MKGKISYSASGVDYSVLDPLKKLSQQKGKETSKNLLKFKAKEVENTRGESAYVWEEQDSFKAFVIEGLGTKNLVADEMQKITGKTYYDSISKDTVAAIVNDLVTCGALPQVVNAYFGTGGIGWFSDSKRMSDLVNGFANACNEAGATWGGGETPGLSGIINPETLDLAGGAVGIIKPKERLVTGEKIISGDAIILIESSGIHANGISLTRSIAQSLDEKYAAKLSNGVMFGEAILIPSYIYVNLVKDLFENGIEIHYMINITGHGWRKLMRANREFSYVINEIPTPQPLFDFIKDKSGSSDEDMYATFNMGAGFAIILPEHQTSKVQEIAKNNNLKAWNAGFVEKGEREVVIKPKNITFKSESLNLR